MLRLDLVYVRLNLGDVPVEMARVAEGHTAPAPHNVGQVLGRWLERNARLPAARVSNFVGNGDITVVPLRLGLQGEIGMIVAGSQRVDFPVQTERLLLSVASNLAAIGLHEVRLLNEQQRVAGELDRRIEQRTAELAAANEELKQEIAERRLAEEALSKARSELAYRIKSDDARRVDRVDCTRSESTAFRHHHQCQHVPAHAGCRSARLRRRARNRTAHHSRRQPRLRCHLATARALRPKNRGRRSGWI